MKVEDRRLFLPLLSLLYIALIDTDTDFSIILETFVSNQLVKNHDTHAKSLFRK
jgi:hypothetical protein